ncbi:MAG: serine/threonine protein kinase [Pseudomonadales bacterium]
MSDTVVQFKHKNDLTGTTLGQYRIVQHIGRGGMADVYKAEHVGLSVYRTIKVVRPEFVANKEFSARFKTEAQAVAMLRHNNIVQLQDFCFENNMFYMVMEFVDGQNLTECIDEEGPMRPVERGVHLVSQIAAALHYAHSQGLIHRDIKPQNILLNSTGVPILTDFGIAKLLESNSELTRTGSSIGTPSYMAPEQAKGSQNIGPAADVYSLAVVLYEILTGVVPFDAATPVATLMKALHEPAPPPKQFCPTISDELQAVILKGMAKEPEDRYVTALHFQHALDDTLRSDKHDSLPKIISRHITAVDSKPRLARNTHRRRSRRSSNFMAPAIGGAAGVIVVGLVATGLWYYNDQQSSATKQTTDRSNESGRIMRDRDRGGRNNVPTDTDDSSVEVTELPPMVEIEARHIKKDPVEVVTEPKPKPKPRSEPTDVPALIQGGNIKFDKYTERTIEHPGQEAQYTFFGVEGQSVYFDSKYRSKNVTNYTLLAPDRKTKVFESDVDTGPWELPQTGAYTLRVDPIVDRQVFIEFVLWHLDPPVIDEGHLELNAVTDNSIARPGQKARYTFSGEEGQSVYFESKQDSRFHIDYRLTAPDETVLFKSRESTGRVELPQTGTYTLLVDPVNTFGFKFLLRRE